MSHQVTLAEIRTDLANQRTLLAYFRSSLAFFIAAAALVKLYEGIFWLVLCALLCVGGVIVLIAGISVYRRYSTLSKVK